MAGDPNHQVLTLVGEVRARWRRLTLLRASARAGLFTAVWLAAVIAALWVAGGVPSRLVALIGVASIIEAAALVYLLKPAREWPTDSRVARFIEERVPALDDRLVSAVALVQRDGAHPRTFAEPLIEDAAHRTSSVDPSTVVSTRDLRRAGMQAAGAVLCVLAVGLTGFDTLQRIAGPLSSGRAAGGGGRLEVVPGDTRLDAGEPLAIEARVTGQASGETRLLYRTGAAPDTDAAESTEADWTTTAMAASAGGTFTFSFDAVHAAFHYRVASGELQSPVYQVSVTRAPRVTSIDVDYVYPPELGLEPRTDVDGGDVYAPAGTDVRLRVRTDPPAAGVRLDLSGGRTIELGQAGDVLSGGLTIDEDASYRVALADDQGQIVTGETEYFIRVLTDRPPDVRVTRPARDRDVTPLEEVEIRAEAHDDFGLEAVDLVYSVGGGPEHVVPLPVAPGTPAMSAAHTLFLEDLDVRPGDFLSYHLRARDVARGAAASETRSDIFFLQVRPFDREFSLVDGQGFGGGDDHSLGDLVAAQKQIIVATWKLDRRADASGTSSEQDIRAVARAEAELQLRVEETASSLRAATMRDPRQVGNAGLPGSGSAGPRSEEAAMTAAAAAMERAVDSLEQLQTTAALPAEMDALNALLEAQADLKRQEVPRPQQGRGGGDRTTPDLSGLFDEELQRDQQTSVEMPPPPAEQAGDRDDTVDRVRELARRQEGLLREQRELDREREDMSEADLKAELDRLAAEQTELRERAEQVANQLAEGSQPGESGQSDAQSSAAGEQGSGAPGSSGEQARPGPQGQTGRGGEAVASPSGAEQMRAVSEDMRQAAGDLGRRDAGQAAERGSRALDRLRQFEDELRLATPDEQRRALGEAQLEARQLADAQRQVGSDLSAAATGEGMRDAMRRMAGQQDRLAERAERLAAELSRQGARSQAPTDGSADADDLRRAADQAADEIDRQRIVERMEQAASELREAGSGSDTTAPAAARAGMVRAQQDVARALERLADGLAAATGPADPESRRLAGQLARTEDLRDRIEAATRELERLDRDARAAREAAARGEAGDPRADAGALERVREDLRRQLEEARALLEQVRRDDPDFSPGAGAGATFEGQGMVFSAPGTEAFKQDFDRWETLRAQTTEALERAGLSVSERLSAERSRDRLASGVDDQVPDEYRAYVDSYFKALAGRKSP